jgi:hypothetical protein
VVIGPPESFVISKALLVMQVVCKSSGVERTLSPFILSSIRLSNSPLGSDDLNCV